MLDPVTIYHIGIYLATLNKTFYTGNPSEVLQQLQSLSTENSITIIAKNVKVSELDVELFFNETIPCLKNITTNAIRNNNINNTKAILESFWNNCFMRSTYVQLLNQAREKCPTDIEASKQFEIYMSMLGSSVFTILYYTFTKRRKKFKTDCCWGRPGPVVPLNMLDSYENRFGYSFAFGLTAYSCILVVLQSYDSILGSKAAAKANKWPGYLSVFIRFAVTIILAMVTYPFFFLQTMNNKLVGSITGLILSASWFSMEVNKRITINSKCEDLWRLEKKTYNRWANAVAEVAQLICLCLLAIKFLVVVMLTMKSRIKLKTLRNMIFNDDTNWKEEYLYLYVKKIINTKKQDDDDIDGDEDLPLKEKLLKAIKSIMYTKNPDFKYSTRLVVTTCSSVIVVSIITISITVYFYVIFVKLLDDIFPDKKVAAFGELFDLSADEVKSTITGFIVGCWMGLGLAVGLYVFVIINSFTWYRKHVVMLRKGDRSFLPNSIKKKSLSPPSLMVASTKFAGYQIAYSIWGFLLSAAVLCVLCIIVIVEIYLPIRWGKPSYLVLFIYRIWPSLISTIIVMVVQMVAARLFFLRDPQTLAVNNRSAYHITSYFLFYFNIFLGIFSCFLRLFFGILFGVVFMQRLQKSTLPRQYERRDPGYTAYIGYLLLEHQHANPILQVFVRLLVEDKEIKNQNRNSKTHIIDLEETYVPDENGDEIKPVTGDFVNKYHYYQRTRVRNRWQLYKMLILNPTLKKYRARPKRQGYLQKALLQVGKVKVNFDIDDITTNFGHKESATDEDITGNDVEMLEIQQVNDNKNKAEIVLHDSPEKVIVKSNHNSNNKTGQGSIIVPTENSLEKRESSCPGKVKNDLEKIPLLYDSEKNNDKNNFKVANSGEEVNLNTDNSSQAPLEQKREELPDSRESNNSSGAVKDTISELDHAVETKVVNYDDTTL